jgi:prephenate dehydrogenase
MSIQLTILGLGKIGASAGLALGRHSNQVERCGFDPHYPTTQLARKIGAVDKIEIDLSDSIKNADVVFLAMPLNDIQATLKTIAAHLREEAVILDTSPAKTKVANWIKELLPARRHYVGISSMLNPRYLNDPRESIEAAVIDLFENCPMAIAAPAGTPGAAIDLAADLSRLLGAQPLFCDLAEMDGLIASTQLLPQLVSTALLNASLDSPGWADARKFAGSFFTGASSAIAGRQESASLRDAALLNKIDLLRSLDGYLSALQTLRDNIADDQSDLLEERLEHARVGRIKWWNEHQKPDWQNNRSIPAEMPKPGDFWKQQVGFFSRMPGRQSTKPEKKGQSGQG